MIIDSEVSSGSGKPEARCAMFRGWRATGASGTQSMEEVSASADAQAQYRVRAEAALTPCSMPCDAAPACADVHTCESARWDRAIATNDAARTEALVLARLDHERESSPVKLGDGGTAEQHAEAILGHVGVISQKLRAEQAEKGAAHIEAAEEVVKVAKQDAEHAAGELKLLTSAAKSRDVTGGGPQRDDEPLRAAAQRLAQCKAKVADAEKALAAARQRYGDHAEALELIAWAAGKVRTFEDMKPRLPDEPVAKDRRAIVRRANKALEGIRFYADDERSVPTEKVALLMMELRSAAKTVPRGQRVAPIAEPPSDCSAKARARWEKLPAIQKQPLTQAERGVWDSLPEQEKQRLVGSQQNKAWRWQEPTGEEVDRALDVATDTVIASVPEIEHWFHQAGAAESLATPRAEYRRAIRTAVSAFVRLRKPNQGTQDQKRLDAEQALRKIWGLPRVQTITRQEEARALLPLLGLINALPRSTDSEDAQVEAVMKSILRGTAIREREHGVVLFEKRGTRARETKTGTVLVSRDGSRKLKADGTTSAARAPATAHSKPRPRGDLERNRR